jgi:hypothetical protein
MTAVAALLRHRTTISTLLLVDPPFRRTGISSRLARFAGRGFLANIDVAIVHDDCPLVARK